MTAQPLVFQAIVDLLSVNTSYITVRDKATGHAHNVDLLDIAIGADEQGGSGFTLIMDRAIARAAGFEAAFSAPAATFAVARPGAAHRSNARFFAGEYSQSNVLPFPTPTTTGAPDRAKTYDDFKVANLVAAYLNILHGLKTGASEKPWIVIELPEAWTS